MIPEAATTTLLQKEMKQITVGTPGTWTGLALRVSQCVFAAASVCAMVTVFGFSPNKYIRYMNTMMLLQTMWSLGLACLDIYAMMNRKDLHKHAFVMILVFTDWIMATLTYAAACVAAGVGTLILDDMDICRELLKEACSQNVLPIVLAFIAGLFWATSGFAMSSLLA